MEGRTPWSGEQGWLGSELILGIGYVDRAVTIPLSLQDSW